MFFRFGSALSLVVLIALTGTTLEKQNLELKRAISHQQYRLDAMLDSHVRLRLEAQRLGTPARLLGPLERGELPLRQPVKPQRTDERRIPLLNWSSEPAPK
jgi:hypothetical protein